MAHDCNYVPLIHIFELYFLLIPEHHIHAAVVVGSVDFFFMPILLITSGTFNTVSFSTISVWYSNVKKSSWSLGYLDWLFEIIQNLVI